MASSDIEERLRNYLSKISDKDDSSEIISKIVEEIDDWWELDDNLSDVASRRHKIQAVTDVVTSLLYTDWKKADDILYDAVQRAVEANLCNLITQRQKVRKSVVAKQNAYIAEVVKKKLLTELPRTARDIPESTGQNARSNDPSDGTLRDEQASILRGNASRPSVNPVTFADPVPQQDVSLLGFMQPDIIHSSAVNIPSLNISAIGAVRVDAPDVSIEEQMLNIPIPEPIVINGLAGDSRQFSKTIPDVHDSALFETNMRGPDAAAVDSLIVTTSPTGAVPKVSPPVLTPQHIQGEFSVQGGIVNQLEEEPAPVPPAEGNQMTGMVSAPIPADDPSATLPDSNTIDSNLPPVRPSQISPPSKRKKKLIIDRVTQIQKYAEKSIQLNRSQKPKRMDPNWLGILKVKNALSVPRLFSSPAYTQMFRSRSCQGIINLYTRQLLTDRCLVVERNPAPVRPSGVQQPGVSTDQDQRVSPVLARRIAQSRRRSTEQIVNAELPDLAPETSAPVTVVPPTPEIPSRDENAAEFLPPGAPRKSSDIFTAVPHETPTPGPHQLPAVGNIQAHDETPAEIPIAAVEIPDIQRPVVDETLAETTAATGVNIPAAQQVPTDILAANDVQIQFPDETRAETTAETEAHIPPVNQMQTEQGAAEPLETLAEVSNAGDDMPLQRFARLSTTEPVHVVTVPETDMRQDATNGLPPTRIIDALQENSLTPIENLLGDGYTQRSKIQLVTRLLKLNGQWRVRIVSKNGRVFVTKFPSGIAEKLQNL